MKKQLILSSIFFLMLTMIACKKGEQGDIGPAGITGAKGAKGALATMELPMPKV